MTNTRTRAVRTALAMACLLGVAVAAALVLRGDGYRVHARFANAGLLIPGNRVEVAGRKVGHVARVSIAPDGLADVELLVEDRAFAPLHVGTRAEIRAVGQAGIANRIVDLTPGPREGAELPDGAVLGPDVTTGIVNVDALLESFGPRQRAAMREFIARSDEIYAGSGGPAFNAMLEKLAPATGQLSGFYGELARDREALGRLLRTANVAAGAISGRRTDLVDAIDRSAVAMRAIASERRALGRAFGRAPKVLGQARGTLARARGAVDDLRPTLRAIPAAERPLTPYLRDLARTLPRTREVVDALRRQLPDLTASLAGLRPIAGPVARAFRTTGVAMRASQPIFEGLRLYGPDMVIGLLAGDGGVPTGPYDALGHYAKLEYVESPQAAVEGRLGRLLNVTDLVPGVLGLRTGITRRCPGGNQPPAPDGSSPWVLDERLCTHEDDVPASVNEP
ncbi:MlaD family protein [Paraconexibacter sp.]|uniref:MlaD family protein n=1 Tax=Paraconexibacter sp. TaxID=2949640 RepID=UPI00356961F2